MLTQFYSIEKANNEKEEKNISRFLCHLLEMCKKVHGLHFKLSLYAQNKFMTFSTRKNLIKI